MEFAFPHIFVSQIDSTNLLAADLLSKTNPEPGFLVITDYQTAGKGQYGRFWQSVMGKNVLASFIVYPHHFSLDQMFRLHLASSLALWDTLECYSIDHLTIKWPNDIYAGSRKIAGILIQNSIHAERLQSSIIGIGINVNQTEFPENLNASSIQLETNNIIQRKPLVIQLREKLLYYINQSTEHYWNNFLMRYNEVLYLKGIDATFKSNDGFTFKAIVQEVDALGNLIVINNKKELIKYKFGEINYI